MQFDFVVVFCVSSDIILHVYFFNLIGVFVKMITLPVVYIERIPQTKTAPVCEPELRDQLFEGILLAVK